MAPMIDQLQEVKIMLHGTAASEGIGIGKVMLIEEHSLEYTPRTVTDTEAESQRFKAAVDAFCYNTEKQAENLRSSAGEKEAEILAGHIQIIKDPYLSGEIEKLIADGQCAESALEHMCDMFIAMFSAADDELTKQRAADVRDIKSGVLGILLGVNEIKVSDAPKGTVLVARELTPSVTAENNFWYRGTADAMYQNISFLKKRHEPYVIITSGDCVYKIDYNKVLEYHIEKKADITVVCKDMAPDVDVSRFGVVRMNEDSRIVEFEEKPEKPSSNLASMGIYIFSWPVLKEALIALKDQSNCDFGKHIIPYCHEKKQRLFAYEYNGYWKDVGTLGSYWEANMELIDLIPEFNLYEEYWKIYTKSDIIPPQYVAADAVIDRSIIGEGTEVHGTITNSVIGAGVTIEPGAEVHDSIIMRDCHIKAGAKVNKAIVAEDTTVGEGSELGVGEYAPSKYDPKVYQFDLVTIGEHSVIPDHVKIGKNTAISGVTTPEDYTDGALASGDYIIKAGGVR